MLDLSKGMNFEGYLNKNSEEQRSKLINAYEGTRLTEEAEEAVKNIDEEVNVAVFSEGFCPDCVVTLPFVERMKELNENIKVFYYGRSGNEELLEKFTGTARIPTVMTFSSSMEPKGAYIEVPEELGDKIAKLPAEKQKELVMDYRQGKYNDLIEKSLLNIIK
jgi:thiol-disulfide isomerase/thioredoxin